MDKQEMSPDSISAFADGMLADNLADEVVNALKQAEGRASWDKYHQIGDVLRSSDLALTLGPNFTARMSARLEAEPSLAAIPRSVEHPHQTMGNEGLFIATFLSKFSIRKFFLPGIASISALAAISLITIPHLMVAGKADNRRDVIQEDLALLAFISKPGVSASAHYQLLPQASTITLLPRAVVGIAPVTPQSGFMQGNSDIDSYLIAHQNLSPSMYSSAQYVRTAMFAIDIEK